MYRILVWLAICSISTTKAAHLGIEDARQASLAAADATKSARASGTFLVTLIDNNETWAEGSFKLIHGHGKVLIDMSFQTRKGFANTIAPDGSKIPTGAVDSAPARVLVLDDGKAVHMVTFDARINPTGCRVERCSSVSDALALARFPLRNPINPHLGVQDVDKTIQNLGISAIQWSYIGGTTFRGRYEYAPKTGEWATFDVDTDSGNNVVSKAVYNARTDVPVLSYSLQWKQHNDFWYVAQVNASRRNSGMPARSEEIKVTDYEPNPVLRDDDFSIESLGIPPGTRVLDRRSKGR